MKKIVVIVMALFSSYLWAEDNNVRVIAYVDRDVITAGELKQEVESSREGQALKARFQGEDLHRRWQQLEKRKLQEMITQKLLEKQAKTFNVKVDVSQVEEIISWEMSARGFETKDQLRAHLRQQGIAFTKWKDKIVGELARQQYEQYITRRMAMVSPESIYNFYAKHRGQEKVEHRSVDGLIRSVRLKKPDAVVANHLILKPNFENVKNKDDLIRAHKELELVIENFRLEKPANVKIWFEKQLAEYPFVTGQWTENQTYEKGLLGSFDEAVFRGAPGKWTEPLLTLEPTSNQAVQSRRYDLIQTLEIKKGQIISLKEAYPDIANYLRFSVRDQEMSIIKEKLWKSGAVRIVSDIHLN